MRFNKKTVLEAGYIIPSLCVNNDASRARMSYADSQKKASFLKSRGYELLQNIKGCSRWNIDLGGLVAGKEFAVREGESYEIEIAISEIPGGSFSFVLFIEDVTEGKNSRASQYDLFRTDDTVPNVDELKKYLESIGCFAGNFVIPFNTDSPVWKVQG